MDPVAAGEKTGVAGAQRSKLSLPLLSPVWLTFSKSRTIEARS